MHNTAWKWEGTGNEFILMDRRNWAELPDAAIIASMCDPASGAGADGVIFFRPLNEEEPTYPCYAWEMDYLNADGSRSFCGNGSRALFAFLREKGWMPPAGGTLRACDGSHAVAWDDVAALPGVALRPVQPPVPTADGATFVDTGSPHHLIFAVDVDAVDVQSRGSEVRYSPAYAPEGTNVDFVEVVNAECLKMRTYERGVEGETRACGTGAVAAAIADHAARGGALRREVIMPGGVLRVEMNPPSEEEGVYNGVWLFGAASQLFQAAWDGVKWTALLVALFFATTATATGDGQSNWTDEVQISILTGSPGSDLYSAWGHTAIRVYDPGQTPPSDWTYNYGTFEFGEGFYLRFMRGELNYRLAKAPFSSFQREYMHYERAILEQPLALEPSDARAVVEFLEWNYRPENRVYAYKFFEDNCSSRVLTVLDQVFGERWNPGCAADAAMGVTYREALRPYMHGDRWIEAGIDFILGPRADRLMPPCGSSFLPDGLMQQLQLGRLDGVHIAETPEELLPPQRGWFRTVSLSLWTRPNLWLGLLTLLTTLAAIRRLMHHRLGARVPRWEERMGKVCLAIAGLLGILLLAMWTLTDHRDTWANLNLLWASPLIALLPLLKGQAREWLRWALSVVVVGFLLLSNFATQHIPFTSMLMGWAVWLCLDPWIFPWKTGTGPLNAR